MSNMESPFADRLRRVINSNEVKVAINEWANLPVWERKVGKLMNDLEAATLKAHERCGE